MTRTHDSEDKPEAAQLGWQVTSTDYPFTSPRLTVRSDQIHTGNADFTYVYLQIAPAVIIVPITPDGEVILIRQYRYPVDEWCLEVPAGGTEDREGESLEDVVRAELREEVGGEAGEVRHIGTVHPSVSRSAQIAHVFAALHVRREKRQHLEATEQVEVIPVPAAEALAKARRGEIQDAQCALALLLCEDLLRDLGYLDGSQKGG